MNRSSWPRRLSGILLCLLFSVSCWRAQIIGGPVAAYELKDGVYEGSDSHGPNKATVLVTINNNRIVRIEVVQNWGTKKSSVIPVIPQRVMERQSTKVDAVSGATNSSNVLMNAVQKAVMKAIKNN